MKCIGCHASTPDGKSVGFGVGPGRLHERARDDRAGRRRRRRAVVRHARGEVGARRAPRNPGVLARSLGAGGPHGDPERRRRARIEINLEGLTPATARGVIARTGNPGKAVAPTWSHDGGAVAYGSTTGDIVDGRPAHGPSDVYVVPYGNRDGGAATKVVGASDPAFDEYYPAYSPDNSYLVFDRVPKGVGQYDARAAELFVTASTGVSATRLAANDPVACSGKASPGVTNSWPKWAPDVGTNGSRACTGSYSARSASATCPSSTSRRWSSTAPAQSRPSARSTSGTSRRTRPTTRPPGTSGSRPCRPRLRAELERIAVEGDS